MFFGCFWGIDFGSQDAVTLRPSAFPWGGPSFRPLAGSMQSDTHTTRIQHKRLQHKRLKYLHSQTWFGAALPIANCYCFCTQGHVPALIIKCAPRPALDVPLSAPKPHFDVITSGLNNFKSRINKRVNVLQTYLHKI